MKRIILVPVLILLLASPLMAASFSIANFATGNISNYDKPLIDAINYFAGAFYSFHRIALILASALGFIGIIWNAFKIIFGTENVRKAAVDIMLKFLLFTFVMAVYPSVTYGILDLSTAIGMHAGGGYANVVTKFGAFRKDMEQKVDLARKELERMLESVADPENTKGKNVVISEKLITDIVKRTAVSEQDKEQLINEMKSKYNIIDGEEYELYKNTRRLSDFNINKSKFTNVKVYDDLAAVSKAVDGKKAKAIAKAGQDNKGGWDNPAVKHAVISLKAINEVFARNPDYDPDMSSSSGYTTPEYLFDPFMRDQDGKHTYMLSPGAMIKIGVVIADIVNFQTTKEFDEDGNLVDKEITREKKQGIMSVMMPAIQEAVFSFFFTIGIIAACVFCAVQYLMTIFEFFILTSVGIVFVPCILWDGTKSFASKLVTLFLAYFFKLMLMIFCLFWVYGFFIDMGMTLITSQPVLSLLNVGYFIFATLLGWVVTQNGPKLATTLLNGTPDLSMGEFVRAAGTAAAMAYGAKRAVSTAGRGIQKVGTTAHKGLKKAVNTFAGLDAMEKGVTSAVNREGDKQGWSSAERNRRTAGGMAGLIGQNIKNNAVSFLTGVENQGSKSNNISNMGGGKSLDNSGVDGKQTYNDAQEGAEGFMQKKLADESMNEKQQQRQQPDTAPVFDGKRDTSASQ